MIRRVSTCRIILRSSGGCKKPRYLAPNKRALGGPVAAGSVTAEKDLAARLRSELIAIGRRSGSVLGSYA